jgi:hypothetical protein
VTDRIVHVPEPRAESSDAAPSGPLPRIGEGGVLRDILYVDGVHHSWSSPGEPLDEGEMICSDETPFRGQPGVGIVFHPLARIMGSPPYDYVCTVCGQSTKAP